VKEPPNHEKMGRNPYLITGTSHVLPGRFMPDVLIMEWINRHRISGNFCFMVTAGNALS
jgi:hypothetical protein